MNSLTLRAVTAELASVHGRRVDGVASPEPLGLRLALENGPALVLGQDPHHPTLYLDAAEAPAPSTPLTSFARAVERALVGSRLSGTRQAGLDRVVAVGFERRDRLGDIRRLHLVGEFLGPGGNLFLVEGAEPWPSKVLETLRSGPHGRAPGSQYEPPEAGKPDAATATAEDLVAALRNALPPGEAPAAKHLVAAWAGMSPLVAREVLHRARESDGDDPGPESVTATWLAFLDATRPPTAGAPSGEAFRPTLLDRGPRGVEALCFRPLSRDASGLSPHETVSAAAAAAHRIHRERQALAPHARLARLVVQAAKRVDHALERIANEGQEGDDPDRLRKTGEAILAFAHRLQKGLTSAEIPDPGGEGTVPVRLNPKLSPAANAELYFKRARKAERRQGRSGGRRRELQDRRRDLKDLLRALETEGPTAEWLRRARNLGVKIPVEPKEDAPPEEKLVSSLRPRRYDLGGGWELLVGKNNRGNDVLTLEIARPDDTWLHASQASGSHVVLRHHEKGKEPPANVLRVAAEAAAFYSKSRNSAKVPVTVTLKRHVRKPRKVPVGTVTVGQHKTLMVAPRDPGREKESA